ncbi:ubiquitin-conjugating enzyme E2 34-like isoform X2 [Durio zibethinus]|uniref:Ubiquitin-conjugating enzyme E2 34-like isoform X2 n=1 Tax=Durio zibethinus TaxID=66656 RepID=A0A6P5X7S3_DURZI|nr:ubiquitin-conjugating enzyme E2 34-like isoform X2 [Durio zibethinus]
MAEKSCVKRLQKEYRALCKEPVSHVVARPSPNDILEWHYVLEGSEGTPFAGGYYYGKIKFPPEYPYKPPGITMITPNGRFMTQKKICLSMSDFHPESWNPMWSVSRWITVLLQAVLTLLLLRSNAWQRCPLLLIIRTQHSENCFQNMWISTTSSSNSLFQSIYPLNHHKKKIQNLRRKNLLILLGKMLKK